MKKLFSQHESIEDDIKKLMQRKSNLKSELSKKEVEASLKIEKIKKEINVIRENINAYKIKTNDILKINREVI